MRQQVHMQDAQTGVSKGSNRIPPLPRFPKRTLVFTIASTLTPSILAQTLGLPGEAAPTRPKGKSKRAGAGTGSTGGSVGVLGGGAGGTDRYVSAFDLSSKTFRPGKPLHDRVLSCLGGAPGPGGDAQGIAVDMVVCSWGEAGGGGGDLKGGGGTAAGGRRKSGLSEQEVNLGWEEAAAAAAGSAAAGNDGSTNRKGGHGEGGRGDKQEQQREREREQCCREVTFPPGFSAERVDLTPETRFFREACCPDLDFVGQGLAATTTTAAAVDDNNSGGQRNAQASHPPPCLRPPPPPPGSMKCRLVLDLFEWLGAVSCGLDAAVGRDPSPPEPYLSEFETPRHLRYRRNRVVGRARLRGFLPPLAVARFVKAAGSAAAAAATSTTEVYGAEAGGELGPLSSSASDTGRLGRQQPDGSSWGSVTAWPFRDAPRAYPGADAPCAGGQRTKRGGGVGGRGRKGGSGGGRGEKGVAERSTKEWPVGGHGVYAIVACPGETAVAYVSARCPGPGW